MYTVRVILRYWCAIIIMPYVRGALCICLYVCTMPIVRKRCILRQWLLQVTNAGSQPTGRPIRSCHFRSIC